MRPVLKKWSSKINLIINGHDHIASLFTYDDLPVLVSGAVFESISAPAFSYQQDGGGYVLPSGSIMKALLGEIDTDN